MDAKLDNIQEEVRSLKSNLQEKNMIFSIDSCSFKVLLIAVIA